MMKYILNILFIFLILTSCDDEIKKSNITSIENDSLQNEKFVRKKINKNILSINQLENITKSNQHSFNFTGKCPHISQNQKIVTIKVNNLLDFNTECINGKFNKILNLSSLRDGLVNFIVSYPSKKSVSKKITKDTTSPLVNINRASNITESNYQRYKLSGTCSENDLDVDINLNKIHKKVPCSRKRWQITLDATSLIDENFDLTVSAAHSDKAGNETKAVKQILNYLSNVGAGHEWMDKMYYDANPLDTPVLPAGCIAFDSTYYVSKDGSDDNDGLTEQTAFKTIKKAISLNNSSSCDLVRIAPGDYYENINNDNKIDISNLTIFGEDRLNTKILSKSKNQFEENETEWVKLNKNECPNNVPCNIYKKTMSAVESKNFDGHYNLNAFFHYKDKIIPSVMLAAEHSFTKIITEDDLELSTIPEIAGRTKLEIARRKFSYQLGYLNQNGRRKFRDNILKIFETDLTAILGHPNYVNLPLNDLSYDGMGSIHFVFHDYDVNGNKITHLYFKAFDEEKKPTDYVTFPTGYNILIKARNNVVIQNLNLQNGKYGVQILNNASNIKVIGNLIKGNLKSIYLYGESELLKPHDVEIYGNKLSNGYDFNHSPQGKSSYRNFQIVKSGLKGVDPYGIQLRNYGDNINIHHNLIYDVGNGVESYSGDKTKFSSNNTTVHHNFFANVFDDALEIGGDCQNCKWYSNHVHNARNSIRIKITNEESTGPVYIYKNILYQQDKYDGSDNNPDYGFHSAFYFMKSSEVPIYVYNNLFIGRSCFSPSSSSSKIYEKIDGQVFPVKDSNQNTLYEEINLYFINNIFSCQQSMGAFALNGWPTYSYTEQTRVFDENQTEIFQIQQKNKQPLFSHNWMGGKEMSNNFETEEDSYNNEVMFNFAKKPNPTNPLDTNANLELNYLFKSNGENPPVHYFGSFGTEADGLLRRKNFCLNSQTYSDLVNGGLDVGNASNLNWNYNMKVLINNFSYFHKIERSISEPLIGINFTENNVYVGPFEQGSTNCNNFRWLLEN